MDTLTHALSGMLAARASHKPDNQKNKPLSLRTRMAAGFLASAFPDIDFIFWFFGDLTYLNHHRGMTHSIILLPVWALILSLIFAWLWRGRYVWQAFYAVSAIGLGMHIMGDVITTYGTMILSPLSTAKFVIPLTFILDPWFTGIILLALLLAWGFKQQARRIAISGLVVLLTYIGYQAQMHSRAVEIAEAYKTAQGWQTAQVYALPQFLLPHHWKLVISHANQYHVAYVNVMKTKQPVIATNSQPSFITKVRHYYQPANQFNWLVHERYGKQNEGQAMAKEIWALSEFNDIRQFMKFPALDRIEQRAEGTCGVFIDHRFVVDGVRTPPFQFGACQNKQKVWQLYRFKAGELISLM